jgi:flagellar biosynthesis protein FlhA
MLQNGMPFQDALKTYTLLTIGDGLVAQIPALIISSAAGIVVTQSGADKSVGKQISEQLAFQPMALLSSAGIIFIFGLVPGMPHLAFLTMASVMGGIGWVSLRFKAEEKEKEELPLPQGEEVSAEALLPLDLIEFEVGYGLIPLVDTSQGGELLARIKAMRKTVAGELGVVVPPIHVRDNLELKPNEYRLLLKGIEIARAEAIADRLMVLNPEKVDIDIPGIPVKEPAFGLPGLWIKKADSERAQVAGLTVVDAATVVATHLTEAIKGNAHDLLGRQELQSVLDSVSRTHPKVIEDLIPGTMPAGIVLRVLRNLLKEKVSVKNILTILETLADFGHISKDPDILTEYVRQALMRTISIPYIQGNTISVLALDPNIDGMISSSIQHTEHGSYLALDPEKSQKILMTLNKEVNNVGKQGLVPILLTSPISRAYVKRLSERYMPDLVVLSHNEIPPDVTIKNMGLVRIDAN